MSDRVIVESGSPEETRALGRRLGALLAPGEVVLLHGDLGAGKTTLTQGVLEGLGAASAAQSPTFTLVSEHLARTAGGDSVRVYHVDLYRLSGPEEIGSFGYGDLLNDAGSIVLVEWPERAGELLPERYLLVTLHFAGEDRRRIELSWHPDDRGLEELIAR
jgi:tRNA threonylcarbamoyladenosine biosynthesis protein TsaE